MRARFLGAIGFMLAGVGVVQADVVFTDGTFNTANYSISSYQPGGGTINVSQISTGGDPGSALDIATTIPSPLGNNFNSRTYVVNNTFLYNPSTEGNLRSVGVSVDINRLITGVTPSLVGFSPVIFQDGNYYAYYTIATSYAPGVYQNASATLTDNQFSLITNLASGAVDATLHPNFDGDPMTFGFSASLVSSGVSNTITGDFRYDNLTFDLGTTTPEPRDGALLGLGLVAVGVSLRRKGRSA